MVRFARVFVGHFFLPWGQPPDPPSPLLSELPSKLTTKAIRKDRVEPRGVWGSGPPGKEKVIHTNLVWTGRIFGAAVWIYLLIGIWNIGICI
jgi:hypothetical protein